VTVTPSPDFPDWYNGSDFGGQTLAGTNISPMPTNPYDFGSFYVGNVPAIELVFVVDSGSPGTYFGWTLTLAWSDPTNGSTPSSQEVYYGDTDCTVIDNLPVMQPVLEISVELDNFATPPSLAFQVCASYQSGRGSPSNPGMGLYVSEPEFAMPSGAPKYVYSPYLTPGMHRVYLEADSGGAAFVQLEIPVHNVAQTIIANAELQGTFKFLQDQVMIPNIQPRIAFLNTTGANVNEQGQLLHAAY
jgi:hypothetical protein